MKATDLLILSIQNLNRTKFRSFLTILGVIIGISAIVLFVSLGVGLQKITSEQVTGMNALTTLTITQTPQTASMEEGPKLTTDTISKFKSIKGVDRATGSISLPTSVSSIGTTAGAIVYGIEGANSDLEISGVTEGATLKNADETVISGALAAAFSANKSDLIGKEMIVKIIKNIDGLDYQTQEINYKIVGIDNNDSSNVAYVPMEKLYSAANFDRYSSIKIKVKGSSEIDGVKKEVKDLNYQVTTIKDLVDQIDKIFLLAQIVLGLIGGIGLLVSLLGIINTMTISFLERTKEIGIMKAIGARNVDIKRLFLLEASLIGLLGGLFGVFSAILIETLFNMGVNYLIRDSGQHLLVFVTPPNFALIMIGVGILISVFAGIYPTWRAQRLLPVDAIRG